MRLRTAGIQRPGSAPVTVAIVNAYGASQQLTLHQGAAELTVATGASGGWYDLALTCPTDLSFSYALAGRLESPGQLTSDPQLGGPAS